MIGWLAGPISRALWRPVAAILAFLGWTALQRHKGAQAAKDKRAADDAEADQQAHERLNNADTGADATDDERIERLRDFAAKHGNRPPKAGGR